MRSQATLRAGLVTLTFILCALFVTAVPVPSTSSSLSCSDQKSCLSSRGEWSSTLQERSSTSSAVDIVAQRSSLELDDHLALRDTVFDPKAGQKIKSGFQKFGQKVKKAGQGIKTAAKKVGHFIKTTGAKIAKFGLKVISTAASVVGKVAGFIPGIGKPIEKAIQGVGKVTDVASNAIHANMGKKLDKGFKIMDKIEHPLKGAGGAVLDAVLKRDIDESELELLSREWMTLKEARETGQKMANKDPSNDGAAIALSEKIQLPTLRTPRDLEDSDSEILSRWDNELDARDEWEARGWNEMEERDWDHWDARDWNRDDELAL